ncbi:MAG: PTS sugar transporter subunit IIA [Candidatus Marinimicrobia bacterium]|jgi:mannitol/fructose-specific phosphotransferase system IIA component (Ntr-type)|nr:PTS sugar transporter subunit IIA [Candidatus Neomarinimicrobiota bacterium]MCK9483084.1 PTS sugar transporter subunit IIA [Candidatus Neomarinimicrobiota bacterium]MCK9559229.1 PTS sugar transporter subunit IIA [Candidatus Neomarinimicrobiota bacterium]MDD5062496.1 PTS sugar transporter subunit IIA [Candidatus Neomarinimicrobiota bacterium]MDD5230111.1 PTS sugar transporter subunit IIA [Candidatus Neomarinimicrobiota bacterium]
MKLSTLLRREAIVVPMQNTDKKLVIEELLDAALATGQILDRAKALQSLLDRENLGSTGLEKGLAIPHARTSAADGIVMALGVAPEGIDFQAADGGLSHLFFLLLASDALTGTYVQILALIARLNQQADFRQKMLAATTPEEIIAVIRKTEE